MNRMTARPLLKHYLPATTVAGGKNMLVHPLRGCPTPLCKILDLPLVSTTGLGGWTLKLLLCECKKLKKQDFMQLGSQTTQ